MPQSRLRCTRGVATLCALFLVAACSDRAANIGDSPLASSSGKWVVLNYWAEWCGPCIEEIPELNQLAAEKRTRVEVLGVNFDGVEGEELAALSKNMGIEFDVLEQDPADALRLSRPSALPTTYLFFPHGELAAVLVGPQTAESLLARMAALETQADGS